MVWIKPCFAVAVITGLLTACACVPSAMNGGIAGFSRTTQARQLFTNVTANDLLAASQRPVQSLLNRGVYNVDKRFNAFIDGLMVNMVSEIRRRGLDPLYFKVNDDGSIEHVPTLGSGALQIIDRFKRQASTTLGGGVITGLSKLRRSRDAEVQMAGNITLVKSTWLMGPLSIIVDYRGDPAITRVRTELKAIQFDALTSVDRFGAEKAGFRLNSPLFGFMAYYGNRTLSQQKITELFVKHLLSEGSFVAKYLEESFAVASYDKIIPHFGADNSYYSVIQHLFSGQNSQVAHPPLLQQLLQKFRNEQTISSVKSVLQKRMGLVEEEKRENIDRPLLATESTLNLTDPSTVPSFQDDILEGKEGNITIQVPNNE